ncbi:MAG TPA: hypothetical protein VJ436_06865 [Anaerolineales bacterium]|nr:hypothetical protein [Anaerolineales bacterium]
MRALPHTYRSVEADEGATISFLITGEAGGEWSLRRQCGKWDLLCGMDSCDEHPSALAYVQLDQDVAWRLFTRGISRENAGSQIQIEGDAVIGGKILDMVSIMA